MSRANPAGFSAFEDKDFDPFAPILDDPSNYFFDQYVDSTDNSNAINLFDNDFAFDMDQSSGSSNVDSSSSKSSTSQHQPIHTWRADLWRHHKETLTPPTCQKVVHRLRPEGTVITGNELLKLEGIPQSQETPFKKPSLSSITPPITPSRRKADSSFFEAVISDQHRRRALHELTRPSSGSSKMMRPSHYTKDESPVQDWAERFQRFTLQTPMNRMPLSPPLSGSIPQGEQTSQTILPNRGLEGDYETSPVSFPPGEFLSTPKHPRTPSESNYSRSIQEGVSPSLITPNSCNLSDWIHPPDSFGILPDIQAQPFWMGSLQTSNVDSSYDLVQDSQPALRSGLISTHLGNDFSSQGLLIQCDTYPDLFQTEFSSGDYFATSQQTATVTQLQNHLQEEDSSSSISPSTSLPNPEHPTEAASSPKRSPSPSSSQSTAQRNHPTRCSKSPHPRHHRRQKSSCASISSISNSNSKRHSSTITPTTPGAPPLVNPGFVNFTPQDRKKILTGVAPSGSSKTKARREKEAVEKSRRMSEAAERVMRESGGDVEWLKREWSL